LDEIVALAKAEATFGGDADQVVVLWRQGFGKDISRLPGEAGKLGE
jgi:hypothetical protein